MQKAISKRVFLGLGLAGIAGPVLANAPSVSLRPQLRPDGGAGTVRKRSAPGIKAIIERAKLGGAVGFSVINTKTGEVLEGHAAGQALPPASVAKSITALYALSTLGGGFRFETRLIATGPIQGGVLKGDLILAGGGDPVLDTNDLADMARKLKAAGVTRVEGQLRPFGGALSFTRVVDKDQPEHVGYNPSVSGLNLNFNRVHFEWRRSGSSYSVAMDARSEKYRPAVKVARMTIANRKGPVYTYKDAGGHDSWSVARGALGNSGSRWLPVRKPDAYAAEVLAALARSFGVTMAVGKPLKTLRGGTILVRHQSKQLNVILRDMLKYSNNLIAEVVGMTTSAKRKGSRVSLAASGREMSAWAQKTLGMRNAKLVDHSGLGSASRVTAASMAQAMARVHRDGRLKPLLKPFAMRDGNGNINKNHPIKVAAKTGTLYFVSSLAGYATAPDGTDLAFAIFTANQDLRKGLDSRQDGRPRGSSSWNTRSKRLQQQLIERWSTVYTG